MRCAGRPFGGVAFAGLDKGLANRPMLSLDDAVRAGIVRGDADVANTIPISEPVEGSDIRRAIVGDDLFDSAPPAQDVLEKKRTEGAASLSA